MTVTLLVIVIVIVTVNVIGTEDDEMIAGAAVVVGPGAAPKK